MSYIDKYQQYLEEIQELTAYSMNNQRSPLFSYTSNFDVILQWDSDQYNKILQRYLKESPTVREGDKINSMEDFARISSSYLMQGLGGNFDITDIDVCNCLRDKFKSEFSLGGTCAQGAAAIGEMGFGVNVHLTDDCIEVCRMLDRKGTTVIQGTEKLSVMMGAVRKEPVYHFILQFNKGDRIIIQGKVVEIPLSNRLILFYDKIHKTVPLHQDFMKYWEQAETSPTSYLISGFDAIIHFDIIKERLHELENHLQIMKKKHPDMIIYFEGAFYMNPKIKELLLDHLGKYIDILGMNEEELAEQLRRFGYEIDVEQSMQIMEGLNSICSKYPVKGIVLHTKDYAMYYGDEFNGVDIEQGLTIGNIMSATRARIGNYGNLKECQETLNLPLSAKGLHFADMLKCNQGRKMVKIVPSRYMEFPKYTIGLGDTFTAGVHTCFIRR